MTFREELAATGWIAGGDGYFVGILQGLLKWQRFLHSHFIKVEDPSLNVLLIAELW
jgi:hypothetical protein